MGLIGVPTPQLIVEDDAASGGSHHLQGLEVVVWDAGSPVQAQEWQPARLFAVPDYAIPDVIATEWDVTLCEGCGCIHGVSLSLCCCGRLTSKPQPPRPYLESLAGCGQVSGDA